MNRLLSTFLFLSCHHFLLNLADDEKPKFDVHYDRCESYNGTDVYFKYKFDIVKQEGDENIFLVDGTVETKQDYDDEYKMSITIFKLNENEEYEQIMQLPTLPMCMFMKTIYKRFFYEEISQYSNLPHYDVCPVPAGSYDIKQYPFNMNKFERVEEALGAGSYRMNCFLIHNDVAVSGSLFYGSITEKA